MTEDLNQSVVATSAKLKRYQERTEQYVQNISDKPDKFICKTGKGE